MITIQNVDVTFAVEGDDDQLFIKLFIPAVNRWYSEVQERKQAEEEGREDSSLKYREPL